MLPISKADNKSNSNKRWSTRNKLMEYGIIILVTLGIRYLLFDTITIIASSNNNDKITKTTKTTMTTAAATGNGNGNDNTDNIDDDDDNDNDNNNFEFVVVLGLEGTGHHLYTALIDQSPYFNIYQNLISSNKSTTSTSTSTSNSNSNFPQSLLNELRHSLFDGTKSNTNTNIGLINAPCTERRSVPLVLKAKKKKAKQISGRRTRQQSSSTADGGGRFSRTSGRRRRKRRLKKKENIVERPLPLELALRKELVEPPVGTEVELEVSEERKLNNVEHESEESYYDPNSQEIFNRVVTALKDIKQLVIKNNNNNVNENSSNNNQDDDELKKLKSKSKIKLRIPINGGFGDTPRYGMLSYPNWKDLQQKQNSQDQQSQQKLQSCRSYQHLSLDLLYHACHKANVKCKHLYIYRNPIDVLISTVYKRNFHGSHGYLFASRLYITMLQVLESQLTNNVENSLGCLNFYEDENGNDWKTLIRDVWGWSSSSSSSTSTSTNNDYERIIEKTYKKKESISSSTLLFKNSKKNNTNNSTTTTTATDINNNDNDNSKMINELNTFIQNNKPYLDLFYTAHQRTIHAGCMS